MGRLEVNAMNSASGKDFLLSLMQSVYHSETDKEFVTSALATFQTIKNQQNFSAIDTPYLKKSEKNFAQAEKLLLQVPTTLNAAFERIKIFLNEKKFFRNPIFMVYFSNIQGLIQQLNDDQEEKDVLINKIYLEIQQLLNSLLSYEDAVPFVAEFGTIEASGFPMVNVLTGQWDLSPKHLAKQTLAPFIDKIRQITAAYYSHQIEDLYIALEILYMLERYYNSSRSDQSALSTDRFFNELMRVKNAECNALSFFSREKILSCLDVLFRELFYESAVGVLFNDSMKRNIITLRLDEYEQRLLFDVYCPNEMRETTHLIHQFKGANSVCFKIMQDIFKDPLSCINVVRHGINGPSKFFERTGFVTESQKMNEIAKIFFEVDDSRVKLKYRSKSCALLGIDSCIELSKLIPTLSDVLK